MKFPLVSIITVNYNQAASTLALIESLTKITYPNIELLVVDNDSTIENAKRINHIFPSVRIIKSPINYGFAAGNNLGIMQAKGKYILLLNNDVVVTPNFLEPLIKLCESNPRIGGVSPKILFYNDPQRIQYAGFTPIHPITMRNSAIGYRETDRGQYDYECTTGFCHGAAMMVPIEVIKIVGMMSYVYFLYYEEADWCERIKKAGYQLWYSGYSKVYHKESLSTGNQSQLKVYYLNRNRIIYLRRNSKGLYLFLAIVYQIMIAIPKNILLYLVKGKFSKLSAYLRAIGWNIHNLNNPEIFENPYL
jgi:hypothetical protein